MSWDVSLYKFTKRYRRIQDIPGNEQPHPLGTRSEVEAAVSDAFPGTNWNDPASGIYDGEFDTIEKLKAIAAPTGESLAKVSLAWVLANPLIASAIIGASRAEQLSDTLAATEFTLDEAIKTQLDEASVQYRWGDAAR
ncbi:oxidoreductase-like protein [Burkholderia sp. H160]|nr:oxidoreductase-like protein [Burkholderia sp. H160]